MIEPAAATAAGLLLNLPNTTQYAQYIRSICSLQLRLPCPGGWVHLSFFTTGSCDMEPKWIAPCRMAWVSSHLDAQNLCFWTKTYCNPVRLTRGPLQLIDLCSSTIRQNGIQASVHGLTHGWQVPDQGLWVISSCADVAWAMWRPGQGIYRCLMPLQLCYGQCGKPAETHSTDAEVFTSIIIHAYHQALWTTALLDMHCWHHYKATSLGVGWQGQSAWCKWCVVDDLHQRTIATFVCNTLLHSHNSTSKLLLTWNQKYLTCNDVEHKKLRCKLKLKLELKSRCKFTIGGCCASLLL